MADGPLGNGELAVQLILDKIDGVHAEVKAGREDTKGIDRRITRVEERLDTRPCETHEEVLDTLDDRLGNIEISQARGNSRWMVAGQLAVAATAIVAIVWKVVS